MSQIKLRAMQIGIFFLRLIYFFLKLLPVQNKYLFLSKLSYKTPLDFLLLSDALVKRDPSCKVVILCQPIDDKFKYVFHIFRQMYHMATSKAVFLERSCLAVHVLNHRKTLQVIQLWHALGSMKKFGYAILDTKEGQPHQLAEVLKMHRGYTAILISSFSFLDDYLEGFNIDGSTVVEIPLPRADLLVNSEYRMQKRKELINEMPALGQKKNILYCPTFRKKKSPSTQKKIMELIEQIDFDTHNFIYSPHPVSKVRIDDSRIMQFKRSSQELLFIADYVISDYSSIIYEAGLMGLHTYLYAYDWAEYHQSRLHNIELTEDVPLLFTSNSDLIVAAIEHDDFDFTEFKKFISNSVKMPKDKTCCEAIVDFVFEAGKNKKPL